MQNCMTDITGKVLSEIPPILKQQIEWDEKTVDRMQQNQRPATLLAVAILSAVAFRNPPWSAIGPAQEGQEVATYLLCASVFLGCHASFIAEQFYGHVSVGLYDHAWQRLKRLRLETLLAQGLLLAGCVVFVSPQWPMIGLVIAFYTIGSAFVWGRLDPKRPRPNEPH